MYISYMYIQINMAESIKQVFIFSTILHEKFVSAVILKQSQTVPGWNNITWSNVVKKRVGGNNSQIAIYKIYTKLNRAC